MYPGGVADASALDEYASVATGDGVVDDTPAGFCNQFVTSSREQKASSSS